MACRGCARNLTLLAHCTEISASASGLVADLHKSVRAVGLQALAASLATAKKLQQEGCDAFVCGKAAIGLAVGVRIFHCKCVPGAGMPCARMPRPLTVTDRRRAVTLTGEAMARWSRFIRRRRSHTRLGLPTARRTATACGELVRFGGTPD